MRLKQISNNFKDEVLDLFIIGKTSSDRMKAVPKSGQKSGDEELYQGKKYLSHIKCSSMTRWAIMHLSILRGRRPRSRSNDRGRNLQKVQILQV